MAHIILTGATGTAGAGILACAFESPAISQISILWRRPVRLAENERKANVIIHKDFESYPAEVVEQLKGATECIWTQGKSSRGMAEDEYTKITVDYTPPPGAARAFVGLGDKFNFVYMSGEGAVMDKEGGVLYARVKGRAERKLLDLQSEMSGLRVYNVKPGVINPEGKYLAERTPNWTDKGINLVGNIFEKVYKSMVISTENLAKATVSLAVGDADPVPDGKGVEEGGRLLRNTALRALAEKMT